MKLATFCKTKRLQCAIDALVMKMNRLLGEGYAFANFHILRMLHAADASLPPMDRN